MLVAKTESQPEAEAKPEEETPAEEEQPAAETTEEEPSQPEIRKHKLKVKTDDGTDEEIEVDEEELKRGYMKSKDYSVKTAQLAREREAVQAKVREAVEPKLKEYESHLETYKQTVLKLADPEALSADLNKVALEGLNATQIKTSFTEPDKKVPDYGVRQRYLETILKMKGKLVEKSENKQTGEITIKVISEKYGESDSASNPELPESTTDL